ncbi:MAG: tetratricopeptide repeat protein [Proteobacteria bacterium]|nr:tetratricopeptide repeat protein [Pseudomonadota bacterium]
MARRKIKTDAKPKRKDDLDPAKDKFINKTMSVLDWTYERRRLIALVLGIVLLVAIVGIIADRLIESSKMESSKVLGQSLQVAVAPITPTSDESSPALPAKGDDDRLSFDSAKARATEALKKFEATAGEGASIGVIGDLGKAAAHLELGEYDKAISAYEKFLASGNSSVAWLQPTAVEGVGYALEAKGKIDEARARFEALIDKSEGTTQNMARYHAARMALKKDDKKKATELFKEIINSYVEKEKHGRLDYLFIQARERLLILDPKADVPALPSGGMGGLEGIDPKILRQLMQAQGRGGPS